MRIELYRNIVSRKRFKIFRGILAVLALGFCPAAIAQEQNAWQFGFLPANPSVSKPYNQQVYEVLLKMLDRWNGHDIEGHMAVYWKSPELLVVVDSEEFNGWQQLHDSYVNGYPDRNAMGFIHRGSANARWSGQKSPSLPLGIQPTGWDQRRCRVPPGTKPCNRPPNWPSAG